MSSKAPRGRFGAMVHSQEQQRGDEVQGAKLGKRGSCGKKWLWMLVASKHMWEVFRARLCNELCLPALAPALELSRAVRQASLAACATGPLNRVPARTCQVQPVADDRLGRVL